MAAFLVGCVICDTLEEAQEEARDQIRRGVADRKARVLPIYQLVGTMQIAEAPITVNWHPDGDFIRGSGS